VAVLTPAIAFAANTTTNVTAIAKVWSASTAAATLVANQAAVPGAITTAAGTAAGTKLAGLAITGLTCNASGPAATGTISLTLTSATAALADSQFPRWIAKGIAATMGADQSQVDVWVKAARRLTTDGAGRRLTTGVAGTFNVYNPNRGRNIGLGIGLGLIAPGLGLGLGLGEGLLRDTTTPAPVPVTAAPVPVTTTAAPEEGSSMPLWAGILLALAVLACIGAAVFFGTQKKEKKKRAVKKAAPVVEEVRVVEEFVPMLAPMPVMQTYQPEPVFQSVQYVQQALQVTYAAPAPAYTTLARGF